MGLKGRPLIQYAACGHQASVTSGTVFHRSHTPLHKWFLAIHLMTQDKRGISAVLLAQMIDVCYETDWLMLHKLRRAMADPDAGKLLWLRPGGGHARLHAEFLERRHHKD